MQFRRRISEIVAKQQGASVQQMEVGRLVLEVTQARRCSTSIRWATRSPPDFDPNAFIRRHAAQIMQQRLVKSLSPGNRFSGVLELKDLVERLPARINKILDAISSNELKVTVDAIDEKTLIVGFQKVANRITVGLIIASLIVGAALLMRIETTFQIWGYPGLAILLFLAAAGAGVVLLVNIPFYDKSEKD